MKTVVDGGKDSGKKDTDRRITHQAKTGDKERPTILFQRLRHSSEIDQIIPEAIDVFSSIRTECAQRVHIDLTAFLQQPLQCPGHRHQCVEREQVSDEVVWIDKTYAAYRGRSRR